jgi:glycosyltransferase involved in cell wall biosynthesis
MTLSTTGAIALGTKPLDRDVSPWPNSERLECTHANAETAKRFCYTQCKTSSCTILRSANLVRRSVAHARRRDLTDHGWSPRGPQRKELFLWVWCRELPNEVISVDIFINGVHIGQYAADKYRDDLFRAGVGDGHHSLMLDLENVLKEFAQVPLLEIEAFTAAPVRWRVGGISHDRTFPNVAAVTDVNARKIETFFEQSLRRLAANTVNWNNTAVAFRDNDNPKYEEMLVPAFPQTQPYGCVRISKYADFARYRFRVDANYQVELSESEANNYLKWYLEAYCVMRGDRRAPLSSEEISFLNEMILLGGQKYHLTRGTLFFLFDNKGLLSSVDLNSDDSYLGIVYWWAIERARSMYVEDCLVPEQYRSVLLGIREEWRTKDYPLSRFMEIFFSRNTYWHFLSLDSSQDRMLFYVALLFLGLNTPYILRYVPRNWIAKLVGEERASKSPLAHVSEAIFRDQGLAALLGNYRRLIRGVGFDLDKMAHLSISRRGNRILAASLPRPPQDAEPVDVQLIGPMNKASGLGQASRMSASAIAATGCTWSAYDFDLDNPAPVGFNTEMEVSPIRNAKINIIHLNAESIPLAFAFMPDVFTGAYNIGYFFWELESPAKCHGLALEILDEVWVSSEYGVDIYKNTTKVPVTKVGMSYEEIDVPNRADCKSFLRSRLGIDKDEFVFLAAFDSFSFIQRKNPQGLVRAFRHAFPNGEPVRLLMKTHNKDFVTDPAQMKIWQALNEAISEDSRIVLVNETLSYTDLIKMKVGSDCYISLHKSEGWGFGMVEAMNLGVPVVATAYSGNMEFCTADTCWLVEYDLRSLDRDEYIFVVPGQRWAEPRHESAVRQMRDVFSDSGKRDARTAFAKAFVGEYFSPAAISKRYGKRIAEILGAGYSRQSMEVIPHREEATVDDVLSTLHLPEMTETPRRKGTSNAR